MSDIRDVEFDPVLHKYHYAGRELSGVTGYIEGKMGMRFVRSCDGKASGGLLGVRTSYGTQVHREVEMWIKEGVKPVTGGAIKVVELLGSHGELRSEVMVSDFERFASRVDIVEYDMERKVVNLYDVKTTSVFHREYCTRQLNMYQDMFLKSYPEYVDYRVGLWVLHTESGRKYRVVRRMPCVYEGKVGI